MTDTNYRPPQLIKVTGAWHKSTYSNQNDCVELAPTVDGVAVRDSKNPSAGTLLFTRAEMDAFLKGAKDGEFDHLVS